MSTCCLTFVTGTMIKSMPEMQATPESEALFNFLSNINKINISDLAGTGLPKLLSTTTVRPEVQVVFQRKRNEKEVNLNRVKQHFGVNTMDGSPTVVVHLFLLFNLPT